MFVESFGRGVLEEFQREVALMNRLVHPHLVALLGVVERLPKLLIVTELMERGSLWDLYHMQTLAVRGGDGYDHASSGGDVGGGLRRSGALGMLSAHR